MNITQEQWEKACARVNAARIPAAHPAWPRKHYPPIGDPATVLKMLEWLFQKSGVWILYREVGEDDDDDTDMTFGVESRSKVLVRHKASIAEAIVLAVLALPEAGE